MTTRVLPGVRPAVAAERLTARQLELGNVTGTTLDARARLLAYQRWAADTVRVLSLTLTPASLDQLIRSSEHRLLHQGVVTSPAVLMQIVENEIARCSNALQAAAKQLRQEVDRWTEVGTIVVPDTSLLLHHEHELAGIDWRQIAQTRQERVDIVIPMIVVIELDKAKDSPGRKPIADGVRGDTRTRARRTLSYLTVCFLDPWAPHRLSTLDSSVGTADVYLHLDLDALDHTPLPVPDAELVDRAATLRDLSGARVVVASYDVALSLRVRMEGLDAYLPSP